MGECITIGRLTWSPPWNLSRPFRFTWGRAGDEWHNPSIYLVVPVLGQVAIFHGTPSRPFDRSGPYHAHAWTNGVVDAGVFHPDCETCVEIDQLV